MLFFFYQLSWLLAKGLRLDELKATIIIPIFRCPLFLSDCGKELQIIANLRTIQENNIFTIIYGNWNIDF